LEQRGGRYAKRAFRPPAQTAVVTFGYDNRGRLISEQRVLDATTDVYNITYGYDQLGNRLERTDSVAQRRTYYVYDTDWDAEASQWRSGMGYTPDWTVPAQYETRNNRLLEYCEFDTSGQTDVLLRTVHYTYYETGHVSNITLKDEYTGTGEVPDEYTWHYDLALYYMTSGNVRRALWGRWRVESGHTVYERQAQRQFFYDGYNLVRMRDLDPDSNSTDPDYPETETWRDYFGGQVYGDFQVDVSAAPGYDATVTEQQAYLAGPGLAQQDGAGANTLYHHGDLIDSSMLLTDASGTPDSCGTGLQPVMSYTAFGEPVFSTGSAWQIGGEFASGQPRYAYAGGWGYESGHYQDPAEGSSLPGFTELLALYGPNTALAPLTFQHVGYRWYQPGIGRFVQRDPIGTAGGLNVYLYCGANPLVEVDPAGLMSIADPGMFGGKNGLPVNPNGWIKLPPGTRAGRGPDGRTWIPKPQFSPVPAAPGAGALGGPGLCVLAAGFIGYTAGTALNDWHPGTQLPYSDYVGDWLYRLCPDVWNWSARKRYWVF
jgi:RHS repeat-associated protein